MLILMFLFGFSAKPQAVVQSIPAKSFLDSLGVNVHMEYTDGKYANVNNVLKDLNYLGITHVRDGVPSPNWMPPGQGVAAINTLAAAGVKFDIVVGGPDLAANMLQLVSLETAHPGMLSAVEGPNEINNWPITYQGFTGQTAATRFQGDLYKAIHGNSLLNRLPVYYLTGGSPANLKVNNGLADATNEHPYPRNGDQPGDVIKQAFANDYPQATIGKVITESGYYTQPESQDWGGVDGMTQAKGTLALYFESARQGISAIYLYQLLDAYLDRSGTTNDYHFGLFEFDTVPKPAAVAIHNLTQYLADSASSPQTLVYAIDDLPVTARTLLLSKSDGSFVIAVWNAAPFWDKSKKEPIDSKPIQARLLLANPASVEQFDPLTNSVKSFNASTSLQISVPDHPVLISVKVKK